MHLLCCTFSACPTGYSPSSVMPLHCIKSVGTPKVEVFLRMKCPGTSRSPAAHSLGLTSFLHSIPPHHLGAPPVFCTMHMHLNITSPLHLDTEGKRSGAGVHHIFLCACGFRRSIRCVLCIRKLTSEAGPSPFVFASLMHYLR